MIGILFVLGLGFAIAAGSLNSFNGTFFEGFESGSLATNGWTTSGTGLAWSLNGEAVPRTGSFNIRAENTDGESIIETGIDTTNYQNVSFSFWATTNSLDSVPTQEYFAADWYNGTAWINVLTVEDVATYTEYAYNLTDDANNNANFAIRFRCSSNGNNEDCEVDDISVNGTKIVNITLEDYYSLNSSLERIDGFNTSNLEEVEYMELNFSINSPRTIDSWYLNFTANGTNACSLGNKQCIICYNYTSANQWIQFINGTDSGTYDGTQGNIGDRIQVVQTGSGNKINVSLRLDEHYNPNIFKWYDGLLNFTDVKWQNGIDQRIVGDNQIKVEIDQNLVPVDADQYKLDFRAEVGGSPTQPLEAYACNSSYVNGHPHDFLGCVLVGQRFPSEFQDVGTKFREIFTRNLTIQINDFKWVILETLEQNTSNYYAIKSYKATKPAYTTHWEYSTNAGDNWTNLGDDYETELNLNWFYDGIDPTSFIYRFWANTTMGDEDYLEGNITWNIDPTNNYPPLVDLRSPISVEYISFPHNVTFLFSDPNDDNLNGSLYLYSGGILNKTLVTDMNQSNSSYLWNDSTPDGIYDLVLEACELGTADLFCVNITREITIENGAPVVTELRPIVNTTYYDNATNIIEISANVTDVSNITSVLANITYPNSTINQIVLTNSGGDKYNNSFTIPLLGGRYNVTIIATDSVNNINDSEQTYFNLEDVLGPSVEIIYPLGDNIDEGNIVAITLNMDDLSGVDIITANITFPNNTNYILNDFSNGLQNDDFSSNTEGVNWIRNNITVAGQTCIADINTTFEGKMFVSVDGGVGPTTSQCGFNSLKKIDGDFDVNISFNVTSFGDDTLFSFRSNSLDSFSPAGIRVYTDIEKQGGVTSYVLGYNNGTNSNSQSIITTDTFGKFRIKKFNATTGLPVFNLYYWNNSGSDWINVLGNISLGGSSRTQFIQLKPASQASNYGELNITFDNFSISGDNLTFAEFNQTAIGGRYNVSIWANDTLGNVNNSETTWFNISAVNDAPSRPFITEPDPDEIINGLFNISWSGVLDEEGDSLRFNISLLYSNGTAYTNLTTNYGESSFTYYEFNTTTVPDGNYGLRVIVYENETAEGNSNSDDLDGNFTVDNSAPEVVVIYPLNHTIDENSDVAISLNVSDLNGVDTIYANVSAPNGTNYTLTNFATGLPSDNFSTDTENVNWVHANVSLANQTCFTDIDGTVPGKMFLEVDANGTSLGIQCAFNGFKRVDGNYDLNLTFNLTYMEDDTFFTLRSAITDSLSASGARVYIVLGRVAGSNEYRFGYNNGTGSTIVNVTSTNDTYGKLRLERFNFSTGNPIFNMYYWNNSGNEWINVHGNISMPATTRAQFIQIKPSVSGSTYGKINMTVDNFSISGDNYTFAIFNQTVVNGTYNVSIFANDSANNINDTEITNFNIQAVNDPPGRPFFDEPDVGDFVKGVFNIMWGQVSDSEGDSLRFNITLLNSDGSDNATIVSDYGDTNSTVYSWNTSLYVDGLYSMRITVYENETADGLSVDETLAGNFTIDNIVPSVFGLIPALNSEYSVSQVIEISANVTEANLDTVYANITYPNTTIIQLTLTNESLNQYNNSFTIPSTLTGGYNLSFFTNDSAGNVNNTGFSNFTVSFPDTCTYPETGNWIVDCSDNCAISSNVDLLGNNISIAGTGNFSTTANITNFGKLFIAGTSSANRCEVYCSDGGCFG
ncbi:hypothetical protein HOD29_05915 [archaeon]|jgi:hypothetical protein|nr:hypothetical protein [archaeon]